MLSHPSKLLDSVYCIPRIGSSPVAPTRLSCPFIRYRAIHFLYLSCQCAACYRFQTGLWDLCFALAHLTNDTLRSCTVSPACKRTTYTPLASSLASQRTR